MASGGLLFVSGQVGSEQDGSPHADPEGQLRLAFAHLNSVLAAAGCTLDDVVDFTVYTVDPERLMPVFFKTKDKFWGEPPSPSSTENPVMAYPETRRGEVVEMHFGQSVPDIYRWLENDVRSESCSGIG